MATSARSLGELLEIVNIIMCEFKNWAIANRLVCSAEKTIAAPFYNSTNPENIIFNINNKNVITSDYF